MSEILVSVRDAIINRLAAKKAHQILYFHKHHEFADLDNPRTYDEKIHWLEINQYDEKYSKYVDKYLVREYITSLGLGGILIPLLGRWDRFEDINFDSLPKEFILKTNHASGNEFYEIVYDKKNINMKKLVEKFDRALRVDYGFRNAQYQYHGIRPCIICEKLLKDTQQERLTDYKVVCNYGDPRAILVCTNRNEGLDYFDTKWNYLDFCKSEWRSKKVPSCPKELERLLEYASLISKPFPLSRVDFYIVDGNIYFGEITLTPSGGANTNLNAYGQKMLGEMIVLNKPEDVHYE